MKVWYPFAHDWPVSDLCPWKHLRSESINTQWEKHSGRAPSKIQIPKEGCNR